MGCTQVIEVGDDRLVHVGSVIRGRWPKVARIESAQLERLRGNGQLRRVQRDLLVDKWAEADRAHAQPQSGVAQRRIEQDARISRESGVYRKLRRDAERWRGSVCIEV